MSRLVVVSNRVARPRSRKAAAGGVEVGIQAALEQNGGLWFGWNGKTCEAEPRDAEIDTMGSIVYATTAINEHEYELYYNGFSNKSLWPVFHYLLAYYQFDRTAFDGYSRVNNRFARQLLPLLRPDDVIWVHDYHLIPLAAELRVAGVLNPIGFFLHIPFPDFDMLRVLPVYRELLRTLCRYDVIGFHTERYRKNFVDSASQPGVGPVRLSDDTLEFHGHICHADVYPIGIDVESIATMSERGQQRPDVQRLVDSLVGRDLIIGVDRLDYSKGLQRRFKSYERLLEKFPARRAAVSYLQIAPRTRTGITDYDDIRHDLERASGHVNGRFATPDWVPLRYVNTGMNRERLMGSLRVASVGLVTPVRDGMNLVAKEYVASQDPADPGMLVLSRLTGAACELGDAILVNPYDIDDVTEGIEQALSMSREERQRRHRNMMKILRLNDITAWRTRFVADLEKLQRNDAAKPGVIAS